MDAAGDTRTKCAWAPLLKAATPSAVSRRICFKANLLGCGRLYARPAVRILRGHAQADQERTQQLRRLLMPCRPPVTFTAEIEIVHAERLRRLVVVGKGDVEL